MNKSLIGALASASLLAGCAGIDLGMDSKSAPIAAPAAPSNAVAGRQGGKSGSPTASQIAAQNTVQTAASLTNSERRRPITSTGYAVISIQPHSLPAQQRLLAIRAAKLDAYRGLAEQVYGQYLDGATTVADATLRSDRVRARVEGMIHSAEVVSIVPVGNDTYELTLSLERETMLELRAVYLEELARLGR